MGFHRDKIGSPSFFIYVNDLPLINKESNHHNMILYADDTSLVITAPNYFDLNILANLIFHNINIWFQNNLLIFYIDKTLYKDFCTNHTVKRKGSIQYNNTSLTNANLIKFLRLKFDSYLTWNHQVYSVLRRLSSSCYAVHYVKYSLTIDILKLVYFANVLSIMAYGINRIRF